MLEKSHGAVPCGHCRAPGASEPCFLCGRPVCPECQEAGGCPEPRARELQLSRGWRLRQVDEDGRFGLVRAPRVRVVSLETGREISGFPDEHRKRFVGDDGPTAIWRRKIAWIARRPGKQVGMFVADHDGAAVTRVRAVELRQEVQGGRFSWTDMVQSGGLCLLQVDQLVVVVDLDQERELQRFPLSCEPTMVSLALSAELDLVALGLWRQIVLFRISDGQPLGNVPLEERYVSRVFLGGGKLAVVGEESVRIVDIDLTREPSEWKPSLREVTGRTLWRNEVSLCSVDGGALLAMKHGEEEVVVTPIGGGREQVLRRHAGEVVLVRFVIGGRMLVTADADGQVIFWRRVGDRVMDETAEASASSAVPSPGDPHLIPGIEPMLARGRPRELRLGMGRRLRRVDETGRFGVISSPLSVRVQDLERGSDLWSGPAHHRSFAVSKGRVAWITLRGDDLDERSLVFADHDGYELGRKRWFHFGGFREFKDRRLAMTPDGRRCLAAFKNLATLVDLDRCEEVKRLATTPQTIHAIEMSVELNLLVLGLSDGQVAFFRLGDGDAVGRRRVGRGEVTCVLLGAGKLVAATSDRQLQIFDVDPERSPTEWRHSFRGETSSRGALQESEASLCDAGGGALLATRHRRKQVIVRRVGATDGQLLDRHTDRVVLVRFVMRGEMLVTADADNRVVFWRREGDHLVG